MVWYEADSNIVIFGGTQQGKSVLGNEIYTLSDRIGIFFNPDGEDFVSGWKVKCWKGCQESIVYGMANGHSKFSYELPLFSMDEKKHYQDLAKNVLSSAENHNIGFIVVTDEAHEFAPSGSTKTASHLLAKRGLKRGVKSVFITQDPSTFSNSINRQADYLVWVGPMSQQDRMYFEERLKIDPTAIPELGEFEYAVLNRDSEIVTTDRTKSKFA